MMQHHLLLLALAHALIHWAAAAPPANPPTLIAYSVIENSMLLADPNLVDNSCGNVTGKTCDPNATSGGYCCSRYVSQHAYSLYDCLMY